MRVKTNRICPGLLIDPTAGLSLFTRILRRKYRELGSWFYSFQVIYLVDLDFENLDIDFVEKSSDRYIFG